MLFCFSYQNVSPNWHAKIIKSPKRHAFLLFIEIITLLSSMQKSQNQQNGMLYIQKSFQNKTISACIKTSAYPKSHVEKRPVIKNKFNQYHCPKKKKKVYSWRRSFA